MRFTELGINEYETFQSRGTLSGGDVRHGGDIAKQGGSGWRQAQADADAAARDEIRRAQGLATGGSTGSGTGGTTGGGDAAPDLEPVDPNAPSGRVQPTPGRSPLFSMDGASEMTRPDAARVMANDTLPRARRMAGIFGSTLNINDAIAKRGTSRERETQGSQHFSGRGLDISTSGMNNEQQMRLAQAARAAGFTGLGFGAGILHVDTGQRRAWAYGNSTYGGNRVASLISAVNSNSPFPGEEPASTTAIA